MVLQLKTFLSLTSAASALAAMSSSLASFSFALDSSFADCASTCWHFLHFAFGFLCKWQRGILSKSSAAALAFSSAGASAAFSAFFFSDSLAAISLRARTTTARCSLDMPSFSSSSWSALFEMLCEAGGCATWLAGGNAGAEGTLGVAPLVPGQPQQAAAIGIAAAIPGKHPMAHGNAQGIAPIIGMPAPHGIAAIIMGFIANPIGMPPIGMAPFMGIIIEFPI
mmetsp:Transcript_41905/g.98240  ORF Transcript_41905/g.98240 Transcript_41905/m.98240 type:complete len:224 (-) Transcript_41905:178-849(-)